MNRFRLPSSLQKTSSAVLMVVPIVFFILFLHPLYLVQFFEKNALTLLTFRGLTILVIFSGIAGIVWYAFEFFAALVKRRLAQPSLWFKLPLSIVTGSLILKFLIPIFNL